MSSNADDFLKCVLRSGLMDRERLQEALRGLHGAQRTEPRTIADHLVRYGKLSRFQAQKLLKGATLGLRLGPYDVLAPIGKGGMGIVYLAQDTRTQQHVAVKVLPPQLANAKAHYLARFQREMELSKKVVHPNIALAYEVGVHLGVYYYIAMEYIAGVSLYRLVKDKGPLPVPRAARLFSEVADGLEHAHSMNLVHRDLKPSNIMITPNDHAKVLDLGLAMIRGEHGLPIEVIGGKGYVVGSVDYMAPEQTENPREVDARADLYALGCTLYFALSGTPPFVGGKKRDKMHAQRHLDAFPVHHRNPEVPDKFSYLVEKLMAKNPDKRIPSARALREELRPWCHEESVRPPDQIGDARYLEAVQALELADTSGDEPILPTALAYPGFWRRHLRRSIDIAVGAWVLLFRAIARLWNK